MSVRTVRSTLTLLSLAGVAACSPDRALSPAPTAVSGAPTFETAGFEAGALIVCKITGPAKTTAGDLIWYNFTTTYAGGSGYTRPASPDFQLGVGWCNTVWQAGDPNAAPTTITVSEVNLPAGAQLDSIVHHYYGPTVLGSVTNAMSVTLDYWSGVHYVKFYNDVKLSGPGTGTIGYWKTHPEAWPVPSIVVGGVTYSRTAAINLMTLAPKGDMTLQMFSQLVAAKLNLIIGTTASCITSAVAASDAWMAGHPAGSGVAASSTAWQSISAQYTQLDLYNNGLLCAPHRD